MTLMARGSSGEPPSPTASFYDTSDDEEGEYHTIEQASTDKGVKLLFSKSKVSRARRSIVQYWSI